MLHFDDGSVPVEHAFDVYHDTTSPLFDAALVGPPTAFRATATDYLVDDIVVSRLRTDGHVLRRRPRHLTDETSDWIAVLLPTRGVMVGETGRTGIEVGAGTIGVLDLATPFTLCTPGAEITWVCLPRARVGCADHLSPGAIGRDSPRGEVLAAAILELWCRVGTARASEAAALADDIAATMSNVLRPDEFRPTDRELQQAMRAHVRANLGDLDLGVDALRATFHCSRSSVYRCFEPEGGVGRFIREQRLLRCLAELTSPVAHPPRVGAVATRWGFENPSHFNRLFRAKFGLTPSAARAAAEARHREPDRPPAATDQIRAFHAWTRQTPSPAGGEGTGAPPLRAG